MDSFSLVLCWLFREHELSYGNRTYVLCSF